MVGNLWFDRETGYITYNVEDPDYRLLTEGADVNEDAEIDPTQRAARSEGRSPAAILVSTFADELRGSTAGKSKVVGVSVKDRGPSRWSAIPELHTGFPKPAASLSPAAIIWIDILTGLPLNKRQGAQSYANTRWDLLYDQNAYLFGDSDDRAWETDVAGFGRVFPHSYGDGSSPYFTTWLTLSPAGDELVLEFAKNALVEEALGADETTDYLSVSFSSTDYIGHVFGPSSLEAEDNILRLDRTLAELFEFVDEMVGLDNTLMELSADHGGPDTPGYLNSLGIPAGYVEPESWDRDAAIERIKDKFSIQGELIETYSHPYLYFSANVKNDRRIDQEALEAAVVDELSKFAGVSLTVSSSALRRGNLPDTDLYRAVIRNFHSKRSGDVFVVFEPNWFTNDFDGLTVESTHGSPWNYDTHVPLVFAGAGLAQMRVDRRVHTVDIAPTLSAYLGVNAPSSSVGTPLEEVLRR